MHISKALKPLKKQTSKSKQRKKKKLKTKSATDSKPPEKLSIKENQRTPETYEN